MENFIGAFVRIYYFFSMQYFCALIPFCALLPKRKYFALRLVVAVAIYMVIAILWLEQQNSILSLRILRYICLFFVGVCIIKFVFQVNIWTAIFCSVGAYTLQHFTYRICEPTLLIQPKYGIVYFIAYTCIYVTLYTAAYFVFRKRLKEVDLLFQKNNHGLITFMLSVLLCMAVLSAMFDVHKSDNISIDIRIACVGLDLMCCIFIWSLMMGILYRRSSQYEFDIERLLWEKEKKQYELSKENVNLINIKCHDMKHYIERLKHLQVSQGELDELEHMIGFYDHMLKTGNEVVDMILAERSLQCEKEGIKFSCMLEGEMLQFMKHSDIYSLFANLIDNAIEAVCQIEEIERRVISATLKKENNLLFFHIENYYSGNIKMKDQLPCTTKADENFHGYGMRSVQAIVKKYNGELYIKTQDDIFSVDIVFA